MNETNDLTPRQQAIHNAIIKAPTPISLTEILQAIDQTYDISRDTLSREVSVLVGRGLVKAVGSGPNTAYIMNSTLLEPIDPESYFARPQDERRFIDETNADFFDKLAATDLLPSTSSINRGVTAYRKRVAELPLELHEKELERFVVDFAWKSASLEGNTYSQIETETLLKYRQKAVGHSEAEAIMIINHKATFERIRANLGSFKKLNIGDIIDTHQSLTQGLGVDPDIRRHAVRITGTNYLPISNAFSLREHLVRAIDLTNAKSDPLEKALLISGLIIYLQPFGDGNKRTARMIANAVLMAHNIMPISYRNTDDSGYKKAALLLDEQHNFSAYRAMLLESLAFALENYSV